MKIIVNGLEIDVKITPNLTHELKIGDTTITITKEQANEIGNTIASIDHNSFFEEFDEGI